ncbi:MAG: hypothetical protein NWS48_05615 [Akkermansiaceae bacterium]|jgi:hypothetical protein|nr:hypothetical protein [Akkermansiaceae bacterium]
MNTNTLAKNVRKSRVSRVSSWIEGPKRVLTAKFNSRNAVFMLALCVPALMAVALYTLPGFLFVTPQHNEYFEFAQELDRSGELWVALGLSACCSFFCFAVPCDHSEKVSFTKHR